MNKFIPLSTLKDTTGIVELCKKAGEPVIVNKNGEIDIEEEYFGTKNQNYESDAIMIQKHRGFLK